MYYLQKIAIIIPSLDPDVRLVQLVENLRNSGFAKILIVNDGSAEKYATYYEECTNAYGCTVLEHAINLGKGRALKTAFNYILTNWKDCIGAVTVDSDGQHSIEDTIACAKALCDNKDSFVLGVRNFSEDQVPFRSRFGNVMTRNILGLLCGIRITDTQTGLRGMSRELMSTFLTVKGERFEYEMNTIIEAKEKGFPIKEVPIQTIYIEENKSSHFNPLLDSVRIYRLFFKFIMAAMSSFLIDILLFLILAINLKSIIPVSYILVSTAIARIVSSIYNFAINRKTVFQSTQRSSTTLLKYYALAFVQMSISAIMVNYLYGMIGISETLVKLLVDTALFLISFQLQREWVFASRKKVKEEFSNNKKYKLYGKTMRKSIK